jgi:flagellar motor switch protein FliG
MVALSGEEKGALVLKNLAPEVVERVLAQLAPDRRARLRALMGRLQTGPETQKILEGLLQELQRALTGKKAPGGAVTPTILTMPQSPDRAAASPAETIAEPARPVSSPVAPAPVAPPSPPAPPPAPPPPVSVNDALTALERLPAERVAKALADEGPRTVSLILNSLEVGQAGEIFKRLPARIRAEASVQFSAQEMPSLEIVQRIAQAVVRKSQEVTEKPSFPAGAARNRKMADMLRLLDKPDRLQVLEALEANDPATANAIRDMLYRFEDALRVENRSMQKILMEIDTKSLSVALRDVSEELKNKFLANLSKRAQDNLQEEMDLVQSVPKDQIEQAQKEIVAVIQRLDLAGELVMTE